MLQLNLDIKEKKHYHVWIRSSELYTENKCYNLNLQNVRATKIEKNSESKEIL